MADEVKEAKEIRFPYETLRRIIMNKVPGYRIERKAIERLNTLLLDTLSLTLREASKFPERNKKKTIMLEDIEISMR
jgi:histone H3/H4